MDNKLHSFIKYRFKYIFVKYFFNVCQITKKLSPVRNFYDYILLAQQNSLETATVIHLTKILPTSVTGGQMT